MTEQQFIRHVTCHQKALRRFLVAVCCGDAQLADDLAQEAFMKAYMALDSLNDEDKFKSWLYRIAINISYQHRRTPSAKASHYGLEEAVNEASTERADASFRYERLFNALGRLNATQRSVIVLHYLEGYTPDEIADLTDTTPQAIYKQLSRGRMRLRELLQ